jgi:hypothetical protein
MSPARSRSGAPDILTIVGGGTMGDGSAGHSGPDRVKQVGRRRQPPTDWEDVDRLLRTAAALRPFPALVPRGVYRFRSFEEADAWLTKTIARTLVRRRSRTSPGSVGR